MSGILGTQASRLHPIDQENFFSVFRKFLNKNDENLNNTRIFA